MKDKFQEYRITDKEEIKRFVLSGKAIFTIMNASTGVRFTYKFKQNKNDSKVFWVYMLCMSNNEDDKSYKFLGGFSMEKGFINSDKAQIKGTLGVRAINWFCKQIKNDTLQKHEKLRFFHLGKCGRCGKTLTTPESIKNGLGPECKKYTFEYNELALKNFIKEEEEKQKIENDNSTINDVVVKAKVVPRNGNVIKVFYQMAINWFQKN